MATHKYRHIGAQAQADFCKLVFAQIQFPEAVHCKQGGCGVGAAATQAAAHGQALVDVNGNAGERVLGGCGQAFGCPDHQVVIVRNA